MMPTRIIRVYAKAFDRLCEEMRDELSRGGFETARLVARFDLMVDGSLIGETQTIRADLTPLAPEPQADTNEVRG